MRVRVPQARRRGSHCLARVGVDDGAGAGLRTWRAMALARSTRGRLAALGGVAVLTLLVAACGSGDDDGASASTTAEAAAPAADGEAGPSTEDPPSSTAPSTTAPDDEGRPGDPDRVPLPGFGEVAVRVRPAGGGDWLSWCLLAALDGAQRAQGLMGVTDLQGYDGMVFGYDRDVENAFWMRNTPTPLSIAWITADGDIVSTADMEPCPDTEATCPTYPPGGRYRYAIEVFQGDLPALGITEGATVEVGGECRPRHGDTGAG